MAKIVAKRYAGVQTVYNMEVFGLHNFITAMGSILHNCRYFAVSRVTPAEVKEDEKPRWFDDDEETEDMESFMCGGEITDAYMAFGA